MGISYSFADNVSYGTEDINNITARLVGTGIAPFETKDAYSPSDLNALTAAVADSGVSLGGCEISMSGNAANVGAGIIYFENGVTLEVDNDGYSVDVAANTAGKVYAYYNDALQTADIVFSAEYPENGLYIPLVEIAANGSVTDLRKPARSRVATMGENEWHEYTLTGAETVLDIDTSKVNYVIFLGNNQSVAPYYSPYYTYGVYSVRDDEWLYNICYDNNYWHGYIIPNTANLRITITAGALTIGADNRLKGARIAVV